MKIKEKLEKNEKYKKFKERKEKFKIIWNNPRYHAIMMLSFWFLVILTLAIIVRIKNQNIEPIDQNNNEEIIENEKNIKNEILNITSYNATITTENNQEIIEKTSLNNEYILKYQNNTYYFKENLYNITNNQMILDNNNFLLDLNFFNEKNIYNLIKDKEEEYITKYKDNSYIINYKIPIKEFMLMYKNINIENENFVDITLEGKETINKITIDMTYIIEPLTFNKLYIELRNINQINEININN